MLGLVLYFLFVIIAIGGVAILLDRLGQGESARYSVEEARRHLLAAYPDETPGEVQEAGGSVVFALHEGRVAIVRSMGKFPLIELLSSADISSLDIAGGGVQIRTTNFADPSILLKNEAPAALKSWIEEKLSFGAI